MKRTLYFLLILGILFPANRLLSQCFGSQYDYRACETDTVTVTAPFCPNCTYTWSPAPAVPTNGGTAKYTVFNSGNASSATPMQVTAAVNDVVNACQYTEIFQVWITRIQDFQIQNPYGAWTGDTSLTYTYTLLLYDDFTNFYEQNAIWSASGGTILSVNSSPIDPNSFPFASRTDTVTVKWYNPVNPSLTATVNTVDGTGSILPANSCSSSGTLEVGFSTPTVSGSAISCSGDTLSYTTDTASAATFNWSVTGGTIVSGQGSDSITVAWPANFSGGSVQVDKTLYGYTLSSPIHSVSSPIYPPNFLGNDTSVCQGTSVLLDATPPFGQQYAWSNASAAPTTTVTSSGTYSVTVTDTFCLVNSIDSIDVTINAPIHPALGPDTSFCFGGTIQLDAGPGFAFVNWSNGDTGQTTLVNAVGYYIALTIDSNGCNGIDTINVFQYPTPNVNLGPDIDLCNGDSILIDAGPNYMTYLWNNFSTTQTNWGYGPGLIWVEVTDANGCSGRDTVQINGLPLPPVNLGPDTIICADTTIVLDPMVSGLVSYFWNTSDVTPTITTGNGGIFWVNVTDANGCTGYDEINITSLPDCVFPGDADYDGVADNNDVLAIGVAFGSAGTPRGNPSLAWYGQESMDWTASLPLPSVANYKQVDTNGDAVINDNDTLAISLNYGSTHNKTGGIQTGGVTLQIAADFDSVAAGDTAIYTISLGDSLNPADSIYGLAFTINYDTSVADTHGLFFVDYDACWFAPAGNRLEFTYDHYPAPMADVAVVRRSGADTNGWGEVCRLGIVTIENISGKRKIFTKPLVISLTDIRLVNRELSSLSVGGSVDSTVVVSNEVAIGGGFGKADLRVYPVPAREQVYLEWPGNEVRTVEIYDLQGREFKVQTGLGGERMRLDVGELPEGIYLLRVKGNHAATTVKLPILKP